MKKLFASLAILLVASIGARAQLLSDSFSYADGPLVGANGSPWTHVAGATGQQSVSGGRLHLQNSSANPGTEDTQAPFNRAVSTGTVIAAFTLTVDPLHPPAYGGGVYFTHFRTNSDPNDTTGFVGRAFLIAGTTGDFTLGLSNDDAVSDTTFGIDFTAGTTYSLQLAYNFNTQETSLTVVGFGTITATDEFLNGAPSQLSSYAFRLGFQDEGEFYIDNLLVQQVPEPSSAALLALGMAGLLNRRRRRVQA